MVSKESLILIAVMIVLVVGFMYWSESKANQIQDAVDKKIEEVIEI
jgi:hypothetical protein